MNEGLTLLIAISENR